MTGTGILHIMEAHFFITKIYSPGGMPDGTVIQERDPLTVPSTRRNPLVADVFERLGYMERRGSGFGKIIRSYEFQANYQEEKKPYFRSDRTQFTVILPNLNYTGGQGVPQDVPQDVPQGVTQGVTQDVTQGVPQGVTQDVPQGGTQGVDDIDKTIVRLIREDNRISTELIAEKLSLSSKTIKRRIAKMQNIRYVGSGYSGHWEVVDD